MSNPADNLRLYRFCGMAAVAMTLIAGAMAATGSPGMWFPAAFGYAEAWGFAAIVAKATRFNLPAASTASSDAGGAE